MRLCAHVRLDRGFGKPLKERGLMEHISRLKICYKDIAYTIKRKHKCSILLHVKSAKISIKGQYRNAFLAYSILSRMRLQKYAFFLIQPKKLCETAPQEWLSLAEPHRIEGAD